MLVRLLWKCLPAFVVAIIVAGYSPTALADPVLAEKIDIGSVWAGHPVDFDIQTVGNYQYVAYYDSLRRMTVASRTLGSSTWTKKILPATLGWDSHNGVVLAVDDSGYIHVSGNMHNVALIYYRSVAKNNATNFSSPGMVGTNETSVTYPIFIKGNGMFVYQFRDGGSGNGSTLLNTYNVATKKWTRLSTLFNGESVESAYSTTPLLGPDGYFHIIWMWRVSPVANTNHTLSHMRSLDLITWKTMSGTSLTLPILRSTAGVVVDPVPSGNGLINMNFWIGFDSQNRPVVTYHKYDQYTTSGISQYYNTRWETNAWKVYQTSSWTSYRWYLDLQGSLTTNISAQPVEFDVYGRLVQNYYHVNYGTRMWVLNETTLKPITDTLPEIPFAMQQIYTVESSFPGMQVRLKKQGEYYLRWETMPANQDSARAAGTYPASSMLRLYRYVSSSSVRGNSGATLNAVPNVVQVKHMNKMLEVTLNNRIAVSGQWSVRLYAINGTQIAQRTHMSTNRCLLNVAAVPSGAYCVRIDYLKQTIIKKINL
jgi:hypothetical protein